MLERRFSIIFTLQDFLEVDSQDPQKDLQDLGVQKNLEKPFPGLENLPKLESSSGNLFEQILRS